MNVLSRTPRALGAELGSIHHRIQEELPAVDRVAAALYDDRTDLLKTFVHSTEGAPPLSHYDARLRDVPSLADLARTGRDRVVGDLSVFRGSRAEHSLRLLEKGYRSSYTVPFYDKGSLGGFLFFDSKESDLFSPAVVERLKVYGELIALVLLHSFSPVRTLRAALHVAARLSHERDPETGAHLDRMSRYTRVIAQRLASRRGLTDEFVEFLTLFAPIHDIGKVSISDRILLKPGSLTEEELEEMKKHVTRGAAIVDDVLAEHGLRGVPHASVLRNVVKHHHERYDGSGYPDGLMRDEIPMEARIVTVADVFDALTSERPYKQAWSREDALTYLEERAGQVFDPACVLALRDRMDEVESIRIRFPDEDTKRQSREGYTLDL